MECPALETHEDYADYELTQVPVPHQCCPKIKRVACKFKGKTYKIGEEWQKDGDYCKTYTCLETDKVRLETSVKNCGKKVVSQLYSF